MHPYDLGDDQLDADELAPMAGYGTLGELGEDGAGNLYQWVDGYDGLGNPVGIWVPRRWRRRFRRFVRRAAPLVAPLVPGGATLLPILRQTGVAGADGLGAMYAAPDGSLYQLQGLDDAYLSELNADDDLGDLADEELSGYGADEDLGEFAADDDRQGYGADDDLSGYGADDDLQGFAAEEDLQGYGAEEDLGAEDAFDGYVPADGVQGLEGYVPNLPQRTRRFVRPVELDNPVPEMWRRMW